MSNQFLLHLPDGTEYGPIDRATLEAWAGEGRLPAETLVWRRARPMDHARQGPEQAGSSSPSPR
jgi:hypothetical protein